MSSYLQSTISKAAIIPYVADITYIASILSYFINSIVLFAKEAR
ncbi:MAG: hypothetical protein AB9844_00880 [Clostridiaceae bacterium]